MKTAQNRTSLDSPITAEIFDLSPPAWVHSFIHPATTTQLNINDITLTISRGPAATLLTLRLTGAAEFDAAQLEQRTFDAYRLLQETLKTSAHPNPVRLWNFLPGIHQPMDERDRYMVFNAGRYKAYCEWWGSRQALPQRIPTASGVGHGGTDLIVHCLAMSHPGIPVENPRQIPAIGYSRRFGPLPPCFARATRVEKILLVGGTASINGEQSMHAGDLAAQTRETLDNLSSLVRAAANSSREAEDDAGRMIHSFDSVRVFHPNLADRSWIAAAMREAFVAATTIELVQADLCRAELLIEIEGVATLPDRAENA